MKRWSVCSAGGPGGLVRARPATGKRSVARLASARRRCSEDAEAELRRHASSAPPRPHCSGVPNHDPNHGFTGAQGAARPMLVGQQGVGRGQARSDPRQRVVQASSPVSHRERRSSCRLDRAAFKVQQGGNTTDRGKTRQHAQCTVQTFGYVRLYGFILYT